MLLFLFPIFNSSTSALTTNIYAETGSQEAVLTGKNASLINKTFTKTSNSDTSDTGNDQSQNKTMAMTNGDCKVEDGYGYITPSEFAGFTHECDCDSCGALVDLATGACYCPGNGDVEKIIKYLNWILIGCNLTLNLLYLWITRSRSRKMRIISDNNKMPRDLKETIQIIQEAEKTITLVVERPEDQKQLV